MTAASRLLLASLLAGALLAAPAASALYVTTPLKIEVSEMEPEAGDTITLTLRADPEHNGSPVLGAVTIRYSFDPQEGEEGSEPPADGEAKSEVRDIGTVTLDASQSATLPWTIPAELDRHNAFLTAVDAEGNDVGIGYGPVNVGDAPAIMMIMSGAPGGGEPVGEEQTDPAGEEAQGNLDDVPPAGTPPASAPPANDGSGAVDDDAAGAKDNATPGLGLGALVAVAALAGLALRRRS